MLWVWLPAGSQGVHRVVWLISALVLGWLLDPLLCVCVWGQPVTGSVEHPPKVSGVGSQPGFQVSVPSPLIRVRASWASGECWGCLSRVHSPGAEGGGVPEAVAAVESSLTSH